MTIRRILIKRWTSINIKLKYITSIFILTIYLICSTAKSNGIHFNTSGYLLIKFSKSVSICLEPTREFKILSSIFIYFFKINIITIIGYTITKSRQPCLKISIWHIASFLKIRYKQLFNFATCFAVAINHTTSFYSFNFINTINIIKKIVIYIEVFGIRITC